MASKQHFGPNPWGIVNKEGKSITPSYIKAYIMCACRIPDGFALTTEGKDEPSQSLRTRLFRFYMSDEFLVPLAKQGLNACTIGDCAAIDGRWVEAGCKPQYSAAQLARIQARGNGNIVHRLNTPEGREAVEAARERKIGIDAAAAKQKRIDAILASDLVVLRKYLKMDTSILPPDAAAAIEQLKQDYADAMATVPSKK